MRPRAELSQAKRIVVKIGSRLLAEDVENRVATLATEIKGLRARGVEVVLVTSGAIALGVKRLGLPGKPTTMPGLQAAAAVGQGRLVQVYERAFSAEGLAIGQVLLTHDDIRNRRRYLNARHAFSELLSLGAVPVVNENDTVSVDEIKFGDNDQLAALVASLVEAHLLIILTDVDGLYDRPPSDGGRFIAEVVDVDREAAPGAGGSVSGVGTGGMASKVQAAKVAGRFGVPTVVSTGRGARPISPIAEGESVGTVFWPTVSRLQQRKQWILSLKATGSITVDAGAARALTEGKKSLLPSGITKVDGQIAAGDCVRIYGEDGKELARGLIGFDADELVKIRGHKSSEVAALLGYQGPAEVVHRDDLVLV